MSSSASPASPFKLSLNPGASRLRIAWAGSEFDDGVTRTCPDSAQSSENKTRKERNREKCRVFFVREVLVEDYHFVPLCFLLEYLSPSFKDQSGFSRARSRSDCGTSPPQAVLPTTCSSNCDVFWSFSSAKWRTLRNNEVRSKCPKKTSTCPASTVLPASVSLRQAFQKDSDNSRENAANEANKGDLDATL